MFHSENYEEVFKEGSKRDIGIAKFLVDNVVNGIEETVTQKEDQRDYNMRSSNYTIKIFYIY